MTLTLRNIKRFEGLGEGVVKEERMLWWKESLLFHKLDGNLGVDYQAECVGIGLIHPEHSFEERGYRVKIRKLKWNTDANFKITLFNPTFFRGRVRIRAYQPCFSIKAWKKLELFSAFQWKPLFPKQLSCLQSILLHKTLFVLIDKYLLTKGVLSVLINSWNNCLQMSFDQWGIDTSNFRISRNTNFKYQSLWFLSYFYSGQIVDQPDPDKTANLEIIFKEIAKSNLMNSLRYIQVTVRSIKKSSEKALKKILRKKGLKVNFYVTSCYSEEPAWVIQ